MEKEMVEQELLMTGIIVIATLLGACFLYTAIKNYRKENLFIACFDIMIALYWVAYVFMLVLKL